MRFTLGCGVTAAAALTASLPGAPGPPHVPAQALLDDDGAALLDDDGETLTSET